VIEPSFSIQDVCAAWGTSPDRIRKLMRTGQIGFIKAGHSRRLLAEHVAQLRDVLEVKPREPDLNIAQRIGQTPRAAAMRRKRTA
jgi:hypothetical protein